MDFCQKEIILLSQLKSLIDIYNRYRDNNIILHLIEDNPDLTERQILELKYSTKVKTRALGAIIKMNKDSEPEEINSAIRNFWFELRSEWIRHNMINNYNMVTYGHADQVSVMQSAFVSGMIGELETLIPQSDLTQMEEIMVKIQYSGGN